MKVQRKPLILDAEQYSQQRHIDEGYLPAGVERSYGVNEEGAMYEKLPVVKTLEGPLTVTDGAWIITGVKGERWAVKPEIFAESYNILKDVKS